MVTHDRVLIVRGLLVAYIYQAAVWCDDCAEEIMDSAWKESADGAKYGTRIEWEMANGLDDERNYDSDEYPKSCYGSDESDCPEHCDGCHVFLENDLTTDGADYVRATVNEDLRDGNIESVAVVEWMPFYDYIEYENWGECTQCGEWALLDECDECDDCCDGTN
jgi:hypothetical protein